MIALLLLLTARAACPEPTSVLVLMTDDQRADSLWMMETVTERLADRGVLARQAVVTTPMCCPARASVLSGGFYARDVGVLTNELPNGGFFRFPDSETLPVQLQRAGFQTGLIGKYLNGYEEGVPYIPPGWSWFAAPVEGGWRQPTQVEGRSTPEAASEGELVAHAGYITDLQGEQAVDFLSSVGTAPYFLVVSFLAPHHPHLPATTDAGTLDGYRYTGNAFDEADVSDKPAWVSEQPRYSERTDTETIEQAIQERLESLLAVDRAVGRILDQLEESGRLSDTLVVFTSDNGMLWGEHRLFGKGMPYQESIQVPLVLYADGGHTGETDALIGMNLDLGATVLDVAGLSSAGPGESLLPLLCGEDGGHEALLIEGYPADTPRWSGVIAEHGGALWKLVSYTTGEQELYNLTEDPIELASLHTDQAETLAALSEILEAEQGVVVTTRQLSAGRVGSDYIEILTARGGSGAYSWHLHDGDLPRGLSLSTDGLLTGTPKEAGEFWVEVAVTDTSASPYHGGPQQFIERYAVRIAPRCGGSAGLLLLPLLGWRRRSSGDPRHRQV